MKIFNIIESLDKGAVENWLVNAFIESRKIKPDWEWTFYCILGKQGRLDERVRSAGGKIIYSPCTITDKINFLKALRKTLKEGQYDILHSHHDYLSGFYLIASRGIKFKRRILHIHNTDEALPVGNKLLHGFLLKPFRRLAIHYSDIIVGISQHVLQQFAKNSKKKTAVLYYGVDLQAFEKIDEVKEKKKELGIRDSARILLFSGRMNEYKNPMFVVDIMNELLKYDPHYIGLFVGEGDLLNNVEMQANSYGISDHIKLLGWRNDLPAIMKASDLFVFPRLAKPKEGLGLVVVEAQAAGLPMFLTNGIPEDAIEIPALANFIELDNNAGEWAQRILHLDYTVSRRDALDIMKRSKFALPIATQNLLTLYE